MSWRGIVWREYFAAQAQELAERRRRERPRQRKLDDPELNEAVRCGLVQNWSPEQIAGTQKRAHPTPRLPPTRNSSRCLSPRNHTPKLRLSFQTATTVFSSAEEAARFDLKWDLNLPGDLDGWKVVE
jgi:hypothetical protein